MTSHTHKTSPLLPRAIRVTRFRSFRRETYLELRPLTLLYGDNNSGKSALLRVLPLLAGSIQGAHGPLDPNSGSVADQTSFANLVWHGAQDEEDEDGALVIGLDWDTPEAPVRAEYRLKRHSSTDRLLSKQPIVDQLTLWNTASGASPTWSVQHIPSRRDDTPAPGLNYALHDNTKVRLSFPGLQVEVQSGELLNQQGIQHLNTRLKQFGDAVQWLQSTRARPQRLKAWPAAPMMSLDSNGSNTTDVLASGVHGLIERVSERYEDWFGKTLSVAEASPAASAFRVLLTDMNRASFDTDLIDSAEGAIQALPILTALALMQVSSTPRILALEEPESHLHPSLQRKLAAHLCNAAAEHKGSRLLIETHSEHVLLTLQLQLARGFLQPNDVLVYWVRQLADGSSVLNRVEFDAVGRPLGHWPPNVFADDTDLARELLKARANARMGAV